MYVKAQRKGRENCNIQRNAANKVAGGTDCMVSRFIPVKVKGPALPRSEISTAVFDFHIPQMAICIFNGHYCLINNVTAINSSPETVSLPRNSHKNVCPSMAL